MPFLCVLRGANHENVRTTRRIFGPRITQITRMRADHSRHSGDSRVTFPSLSFRMFVAPLLVAALPRCASAFKNFFDWGSVALGPLDLNRRTNSTGYGQASSASDYRAATEPKHYPHLFLGFRTRGNTTVAHWEGRLPRKDPAPRNGA